MAGSGFGGKIKTLITLPLRLPRKAVGNRLAYFQYSANNSRDLPLPNPHMENVA